MVGEWGSVGIQQFHVALLIFWCNLQGDLWDLIFFNLSTWYLIKNILYKFLMWHFNVFDNFGSFWGWCCSVVICILHLEWHICHCQFFYFISVLQNRDPTVNLSVHPFHHETISHTKFIHWFTPIFKVSNQLFWTQKSSNKNLYVVKHHPIAVRTGWAFNFDDPFQSSPGLRKTQRPLGC